MKRRISLAVLGATCALLIACGAFLLVAVNSGEARLMSIDGIKLAGTACLGPKNSLRSGAQLKISTTWLTERDLVGVLADYAALGYRTIDSYSQSLEMLPAEPHTFDLLVADAKLQRAISLAYTANLDTRIQAITTLTLCLP